MQGKPNSLKIYNSVLANMALGTFTPAQLLEEFEVVVTKEKNTFLSYMTNALAKVSNGSKARQYHATSSALHHGLSRYGHHFHAHLGNMMKLTNFDKERKKHLDNAGILARSSQCCSSAHSTSLLSWAFGCLFA